jgi:hypothetical protein
MLTMIIPSLLMPNHSLIPTHPANYLVHFVKQKFAHLSPHRCHCNHHTNAARI